MSTHRHAGDSHLKHALHVRAMLAPWLLVLAFSVAGCGQKGPLYLPDKPGEVVGGPDPENGSAGANSPRTVDSPPSQPSPAPEVTAPEGAAAAEDEQDRNAPGAPPRR
jgi:predicted small lipoprotein YifL